MPNTDYHAFIPKNLKILQNENNLRLKPKQGKFATVTTSTTELILFLTTQVLRDATKCELRKTGKKKSCSSPMIYLKF